MSWHGVGRGPSGHDTGRVLMQSAVYRRLHDENWLQRTAPIHRLYLLAQELEMWVESGLMVQHMLACYRAAVLHIAHADSVLTRCWSGALRTQAGVRKSVSVEHPSCHI
jgi:hypothetical protein